MLKLHITPRTTLSKILKSIWALNHYETSTTFRTVMVKPSRAHGFVASRGFPQACTRTTLSRPFRHRSDPVQASPTMCQLARRLGRVKLTVIVAIDRPFDDGRVQTVNVAVNAFTVSAI